MAEALQARLLAYCEAVVWDQGVFEPGSYTLDSLTEEAKRSDFAVLVATPDDMRASRGLTVAVPRDNVILEFGLFVGVLGRNRTLVLAVDEAQLPTDTLGLTRLTYHPQENLEAAVSVAASQVRVSIGRLGRRTANETSVAAGAGALDDELAMLEQNATAQGWRFKNNRTTLRLISPKKRAFSLSKTTPEATRVALRPFVATLRASGLRVNHALRDAPAESPLF